MRGPTSQLRQAGTEWSPPQTLTDTPRVMDPVTGTREAATTPSRTRWRRGPCWVSLADPLPQGPPQGPTLATAPTPSWCRQSTGRCQINVTARLSPRGLAEVSGAAPQLCGRPSPVCSHSEAVTPRLSPKARGSTHRLAQRRVLGAVDAAGEGREGQGRVEAQVQERVPALPADADGAAGSAVRQEPAARPGVHPGPGGWARGAPTRRPGHGTADRPHRLHPSVCSWGVWC